MGARAVRGWGGWGFVAVTWRLRRGRRGGTREGGDGGCVQGARDIREDALGLQRRVREVYLSMAARDASLRVVDCSTPTGAMESPEGIFEKIRGVLAPIIIDAR